MRAGLAAEERERRKMAAVVLTRLNPTRFSELLLPHISHNLHKVYEQVGQRQALAAYTQFPTLGLLQDVLQERNEALLAEIFYLLTAVQEASDVDVIVQSLRSEEGRVRANAVEALESLTSPQTAALISPLFETDQSLEELVKLGRLTWEDMQQPKADDLLRQWQGNGADSWLQVMATFALGEIGVGQRIGEGRGTRGERGKRRRRRGSGDLLDKLWRGNRSRRRSRGDERGGVGICWMLCWVRLKDGDSEEKRPLAAGVAGEWESRARVRHCLGWRRLRGCWRRPLPVRMWQNCKRRRNRLERTLAGTTITEAFVPEKKEISIIEKIAFLKNVPFFQGITVSQLRALAGVCEAQFFVKDNSIYQQGEAGGELYVVISGRVGIEQEAERKGSFKRLQTVEANGYFGEMNLFDGVAHEASAVVTRDTLALRLRREPLLDLARQSPSLSIALIQALSQRLREATRQAAGLSGANVSQLEKLLG